MGCIERSREYRPYKLQQVEPPLSHDTKRR